MESNNSGIVPQGLYSFLKSNEDFVKVIRNLEIDFEKKTSYENFVKTPAEKSRMNRIQIDLEKEILASDEKWTVPEIMFGSEAKEFSCDFAPESSCPPALSNFGCYVSYLSSITEKDPIGFSEDHVDQESQHFFEIADFVENHIEKYNLNESLEFENTEQNRQIWHEMDFDKNQDYVHSFCQELEEEFPEFQLLEPIENPCPGFNLPKGTEIFSVKKPFSIEGTDAIREKDQPKSVKAVKSLKSRKSEKFVSKQKKEKSSEDPFFLTKIELNNHFEDKGEYEFNVCGKKLTLNSDSSDFMKFYAKGNLQGMTSYILEKLTERKNGTKPKKTDSVPKKVINSLKKFVETLVPKKYFNRKMTLTKMTEQLLSQAHFSDKRRFRNRKKYLDILKSIENYEESEE